MREQDDAQASGQGATAWERQLVNRLAFAALREQRKNRRWNLVFRFFVLAYATLLLLVYMPRDWVPTFSRAPHTALVDVRGVIADSDEASGTRVVAGLRAAFEDPDTAGVIVRINSPGGSPVQAGFINDEIARLKAQSPDIPLYAVITDVCASGGYYVAAAADKIYADKASVVGSIGVLMNGFGFVDAMQKLGVERRLVTAGEHKALLDPFSPVNPDDIAHADKLLAQIHKQFIDVVRRGRGDKLASDDKLFSGLIWSGEEGVELGLVDELANAGQVARDVIGAEKIVNFTARKDVLSRLAETVGASMARHGAQIGREWTMPQLR